MPERLHITRWRRVGLYTAVPIVVAWGVWATVSFFSASAGAKAANTRTYICSATGKTFQHDLVIGETTPVYSPKSGKNTGYPAEPCYWNADGTKKDEPTYVLLNQHAGKSEPTFCPECGRLVVPLNPGPASSRRPPPTAEEYAARPPADPRDDE